MISRAKLYKNMDDLERNAFNKQLQLNEALESKDCAQIAQMLVQILGLIK